MTVAVYASPCTGPRTCVTSGRWTVPTFASTDDTLLAGLTDGDEHRDSNNSQYHGYDQSGVAEHAHAGAGGDAEHGDEDPDHGIDARGAMQDAYHGGLSGIGARSDAPPR